MNPRLPQLREGTVNLSVQASKVLTGFRVITAELLAGAPLEIKFFVENLGPLPLKMAVSGDSLRQRPGQFRFTASFNGLSLEDDPLTDEPYPGGPAGLVRLSIDQPWNQTLILNQFVRLEQTIGQLEQGASGRLDLSCRRPLALAATDTGALSDNAAVFIAVNLNLDLRRDDAALAALAARLLDEVLHMPQALRERPLSLLLSMRSAARTQIEALSHHPDASVAARALLAARA